MNEIQLNPSVKVKIMFEGAEYIAARPNMGAAIELEAKLSSAKTSGTHQTQFVLDFLTRCGLPMDLLTKLDSEQVEQIVNALTPAKKN